MKKIETKLPGVYIIEPQVIGDQRGYFMETWSTRNFEQLGLEYNFVQDNQSFSAQKGILRGIHFQNNPMAQAKLVRVIKGSVYDVAVDLRADSPTYGKYHGELLTEENKKQFLIPRGFAHGFLVLSDYAEFAYKCSDFYHPNDEGGLIWNDPDLGVEWPLQEGVELNLSEKDTKWGGIKEFC